MLASSEKVIARNKKVSNLRGEKWKTNLKKGWLDSQMHPTKIKLARVNKNVSQTVLAKKADISLSTYGGIERAKRPTSTEVADILAKSLGMTRQKLFKEVATGKFLALK